jgi:hypothetical protein
MGFKEKEERPPGCYTADNSIFTRTQATPHSTHALWQILQTHRSPVASVIRTNWTRKQGSDSVIGFNKHGVYAGVDK